MKSRKGSTNHSLHFNQPDSQINLQFVQAAQFGIQMYALNSFKRFFISLARFRFPSTNP